MNALLILIIVFGAAAPQVAHADRSSCLSSCSERYLHCRSSQSDTQCSHQRIFCEANCPDTRQDNYGAIAYDIGTGVWGWSGDFPSQQAADRHALQKCATRSRKCSVVVRFVNGCGALAGGQATVWGWGKATSREAAERVALSECNKRGKGCSLRVWACTAR
jgi:hypothetical protein